MPLAGGAIAIGRAATEGAVSFTPFDVHHWHGFGIDHYRLWDGHCQWAQPPHPQRFHQSPPPTCPSIVLALVDQLRTQATIVRQHVSQTLRLAGLRQVVVCQPHCQQFAVAKHWLDARFPYQQRLALPLIPVIDQPIDRREHRFHSQWYSCRRNERLFVACGYAHSCVSSLFRHLIPHHTHNCSMTGH